jgi:hypothetical protein
VHTDSPDGSSAEVKSLGSVRIKCFGQRPNYALDIKHTLTLLAALLLAPLLALAATSNPPKKWTQLLRDEIKIMNKIISSFLI